MLAILGRDVDEMGDEELEALFLQNSVLSAALSVVLRRVEAEEAVAQWKDLRPDWW
ncbi:hypothetical protein F5B18DRAFT_630939 [Nemania serpens]|nr:hypothetical protein F5B18DRAFT_630939 [Nemania serpens]